MDVSVVDGLAYGSSGQRMDAYFPEDRPDPCPIVLLWHGRGPNERDVLAPLSRAIASLGVGCFVPDWRPDAEDGGQTDLRESALFVERHGADFNGDATRITLAGWSLGGKTAVAVALDDGALDGWRPQAVVAIAGGYTSPDPLTGRAALERLAGDDVLASPLPVHVIHGTADSRVDVEQARRLHSALRKRGWPATLTELDADHAGAVMTVYDPEARRCLPARDERMLRAGNETARVVAQAAKPAGKLVGAASEVTTPTA
ncbi:acetyl esterase/lipase [Catenulispora sp. GAS73]|uniref:alpha/beta hydrolase n=1 Tax=Catenulispora sp. GAS73 TaxID=3156269 RepID=UPI00351799DB